MRTRGRVAPPGPGQQDRTMARYGGRPPVCGQYRVSKDIYYLQTPSLSKDIYYLMDTLGVSYTSGRLPDTLCVC
jgi:hypothetical protein